MSENQVWTWYPSTPHSMRLAKAMRVVWFVSAIQALGNQNGGVHVMASPPGSAPAALVKLKPGARPRPPIAAAALVACAALV